ncbi:hypothetical protein [Rhodococcus xishaensis]|uniref:Lipoprotein n=1 Tax=Rhodococcus xishaensis TaxID=2487364 RepID=A0A438B2Z8_9NOCA|nr:hypothetical protein [Rhodococcus xishaensis]RVW05341.1 hypothetical protein EGT50_01645 [Rhodococcus xishaensis]
MKRTLVIAALSATALILGGCGSSDGEPSNAELHASACERFEAITPGFFETREAIETLSDPNASVADRAEAMELQLDRMSGSNKRTRPYNCDDPRDKKFFDDYYSKLLEEE